MDGALAFFAPHLGQCFAATIAPGTVDRHCFSDVYGGSHVRDVHVVTANGQQVYSGESIYSFNGTAVEFTYFNSMGGVGHGTVAPSGSSADFAMTMQAKPGAPSVAYRTRWTLGAEHYDVATDGKPSVRFTRTRGP